jgi:hypothetical protein
MSLDVHDCKSLDFRYALSYLPLEEPRPTHRRPRYLSVTYFGIQLMQC